MVEPQPELFRRLEKSGDTGVGLERPRNGANQIPLGVAHFVVGGTVPRHVSHFRLDRVQRPVNIVGIDPGADKQRPGDVARLEHAAGTVGHPLPLADAPPQASADTVLT